MPIDRRDPEFPALQADTHWRIDSEFIKGTIGESTYLRSLFLIGVKPDDAQQSLRDLKAIKARCRDYETERLAASRRWMETRNAR